ncbi:hypothetical protein GMRT_10292 [Giardia muris]|uniref:Uncharacterized protein n=1 Tax=Giardia muris TaxID=5742 RepID=A0A4Z1T9N3_GIAMU|nr:hypothetical protein GMRT_10292 [Giardia muris]|eukprot:TNJ29867.1 hypothetical protein GMRT_10292 [Giardia muris]
MLSRQTFILVYSALITLAIQVVLLARRQRFRPTILLTGTNEAASLALFRHLIAPSKGPDSLADISEHYGTIEALECKMVVVYIPRAKLAEYLRRNRVAVRNTMLTVYTTTPGAWDEAVQDIQLLFEARWLGSDVILSLLSPYSAMLRNRVEMALHERGVPAHEVEDRLLHVVDAEATYPLALYQAIVQHA